MLSCRLAVVVIGREVYQFAVLAKNFRQTFQTLFVHEVLGKPS